MAEPNSNSRLEAFCDGVFAIAITLLVIDIKIPSIESIHSTNDLWLALQHILPSLFAFILSFIIIFITWVNHHGTLKLINKSTSSFIFANGFLMLTVVIIPFPTALLGEYIMTDHSSPAVIIYVLTMVFQAVGWILLTGAVLKNRLYKDDESSQRIRQGKKNGYFAFVLYSLCAAAAIRFPFVIAVITTCIWIYWLILSIRFKHE